VFMGSVPHFQASMANVNLSAHAYWTPDASFTSYLNYGAAISEVSLFQITILAVQITILVAFKIFCYNSSANVTAKSNCWRLQLQFFSKLQTCM
jgi:indole-3-acetaldehyde oxidase